LASIWVVCANSSSGFKTDMENSKQMIGKPATASPRLGMRRYVEIRPADSLMLSHARRLVFRRKRSLRCSQVGGMQMTYQRFAKRRH